MSKQQKLKIENSRQLSTVGLALLTAVGGLILFVIEKRSVTLVFWTLIVLAGLLCVLSLLCGGIGISVMRRRNRQKWSSFNLQAVFALSGFLVLSVASFCTGRPLEERISKELDQLEAQINYLTPAVNRDQSATSSLRQEFAALKTRVTIVEQRSNLITPP